MKKGRFEASRASRPATKNTAENNAAKTPEKKHRKLVWIVLGVLILAIIGGTCAYGISLQKQDKIFPNVYIASVDVGGMTKDEATAAISQSEDFGDNSTLQVILPDRTAQFGSDITNMVLDPAEAVNAAMAYGRSSGPIQAIIQYQQAKHHDYHVDLTSSINLDTEAIRAKITEIAEDVASELMQPVVKVDEAAKTITVTTGSSEISLDEDGLYDAILARLNSGDLSDLKFDYDTVNCDAVDLKAYYEKYCTEAKDAYYDEDTHELVAEEKGFGFDLTYYSQQIAMAEPGTKIVIQMEDMEPEVTLEELSKQYFSYTLGSCDSPHTANANRTTNLTLACKAIDGTILNPGETFSFNDTVGERTAEAGFKPATVYASGGKSEEGLGGGVCQVASTIYTACLYADMDVIERSPHMYLVTYVEAGMDATVYWGSLDYKFKNNSDYPIRIDASVSGGYVHIKLVGTEDTKRDWDHIELSHETVATKAWTNAIEGSNKTITIIPGGGKNASGKAIDIAVDSDGNKYVLGEKTDYPYTGYTVKAYRSYIAKDGSVLEKELLHTDVYNSRNQHYSVTKYVEPTAETPKQDTTPETTTPTTDTPSAETPTTDTPVTDTPTTDTPITTTPTTDTSTTPAAPQPGT